jgi:hypothetical protein
MTSPWVLPFFRSPFFLRSLELASFSADDKALRDFLAAAEVFLTTARSPEATNPICASCNLIPGSTKGRATDGRSDFISRSNCMFDNANVSAALIAAIACSSAVAKVNHLSFKQTRVQIGQELHRSRNQQLHDIHRYERVLA